MEDLEDPSEGYDKAKIMTTCLNSKSVALEFSLAEIKSSKFFNNTLKKECVDLMSELSKQESLCKNCMLLKKDSLSVIKAKLQKAALTIKKADLMMKEHKAMCKDHSAETKKPKKATADDAKSVASNATKRSKK